MLLCVSSGTWLRFLALRFESSPLEILVEKNSVGTLLILTSSERDVNAYFVGFLLPDIVDDDSVFDLARRGNILGRRKLMDKFQRQRTESRDMPLSEQIQGQP